MADKGKFARWNHLIGSRIDAVTNFYDPTTALPSAPTTGDRYIASATGNGWTINRIYEYNGSGWDETVNANDMQVTVTDRSAQYWFDGTSWVVISTAIKKGRSAYVTNTPSPRAAEWHGDETNRHTTRAGRTAFADWRPNEDVSGSSSSLMSSSIAAVLSSSSIAAVLSSSSIAAVLSSSSSSA
jgi:hypothetical protein